MSQDKIELHKNLLQQAMKDRFPGHQLAADPRNKDKLLLLVEKWEIEAIDLFLLLAFVTCHLT